MPCRPLAHPCSPTVDFLALTRELLLDAPHFEALRGAPPRGHMTNGFANKTRPLWMRIVTSIWTYFGLSSALAAFLSTELLGVTNFLADVIYARVVGQVGAATLRPLDPGSPSAYAFLETGRSTPAVATYAYTIRQTEPGKVANVQDDGRVSCVPGILRREFGGHTEEKAGIRIYWDSRVSTPGVKGVRVMIYQNRVDIDAVAGVRSRSGRKMEFASKTGANQTGISSRDAYRKSRTRSEATATRY